MSRFTQDRPIQGFTVIELMIIIVIVAILTALAVPAYRDYTIRSKVIECINGAAVAKLGVSEYQQALGAWPPSLGDAGLVNSNVSQFCYVLINYQASTGEFTVDLNEGAIDPILAGDIEVVLKPTMATSRFIDWECLKGTTLSQNLKYLPPTCRDG